VDFGKEYYTQTAYFLARGRTLDVIAKYEADKENSEKILEDIGTEFGAERALSDGTFFSDRELDEAIFTLEKKYEHQGRDKYIYQARTDTAEGRTLLERVKDVPSLDLTQRIFARRLTGIAEVKLNPDNIDHHGERHYYLNRTDIAATFSRIGTEYVVQVPRVLRAVFDASAKPYPENRPFGTMCESHRFEWFTPPDSKAVPYSMVIELRERELGDQLAQRTVHGKALVPFNPR
jgi:hypothetical protein